MKAGSFIQLRPGLARGSMEKSTSHATTLMSADTPALFEAAVHKAAALLKKGELAALPTETVYGLAANALDATAVAKIFSAKGRPANNPLIVHVSDQKMVMECVAAWPDLAQRLSDAFWPGPLTLVLPCTSRVPRNVTAGGDTVAIRWPAHPIMLEVIKACGFPLAAPSANLSNRASPTTAAHVLNQLKGRIPLIVDGGACNVGIESTVLDLTCSPPRILRPGMIHEQAILAVTGELTVAQGAVTGTLKSPGMLCKHYSPAAKLVIWKWNNDTELLAQIKGCQFDREKTAIITHTRIPSDAEFGRISVVPRDAQAFARALYAELHACDAIGLKAIVVEQPPDAPEWRGVMDRLSRAAAP